MPLIPGVNEREVTPNAADTPYFKIDATTDEFGAGVDKSMLGLGASLVDAVQPAMTLEKKLTEKAQPDKGDDGYHIDLPMPQFSPDLSKAIDATNHFDAGAQDLQSGFLQLSGKDAVDGQATAQQGIDQLKDDTLANAPTPAAADAARPAIAYRADAAKAVIDRHATAQQRVYDDDLDDTQVAQGRNSVGQLYNDDENYLTQLHVATQARADQVLRASANDNAPADPDSLAATITSAQQATASDYTRARIEGALGQGDIATATALTDRWGNDLLPGDKDAVDQHLTYAIFNQDSQQATSQAMLINQPAPSNTPLGRQRNADMVLHRSGGAGNGSGDQVADVGSGSEETQESLPPSAANHRLNDQGATHITATEAFDHYKAGSGLPLRMNINQLNLSGIRPEEFDKFQAALSDGVDKDLDIKQAFSMSRSSTNDYLLLGDVTLRLRGHLTFDKNGGWNFNGNYKVYDDTYDFNKSTHRWFGGELLTSIGRQTPGKPFQIEIRGAVPVQAKGQKADETPPIYVGP